eukprot:2224415-Rhodomonas_salina.3
MMIARSGEKPRDDEQLKPEGFAHVDMGHIRLDQHQRVHRLPTISIHSSAQPASEPGRAHADAHTSPTHLWTARTTNLRTLKLKAGPLAKAASQTAGGSETT